MYDYKCFGCQLEFEALTHDGQTTKCKQCEGLAIRQLTAPRIISGGEYHSGNSISGVKPIDRSKKFS